LGLISGRTAEGLLKTVTQAVWTRYGPGDGWDDDQENNWSQIENIQDPVARAQAMADYFKATNAAVMTEMFVEAPVVIDADRPEGCHDHEQEKEELTAKFGGRVYFGEEGEPWAPPPPGTLAIIVPGPPPTREEILDAADRHAVGARERLEIQHFTPDLGDRIDLGSLEVTVCNGNVVERRKWIPYVGLLREGDTPGVASYPDGVGYVDPNAPDAGFEIGTESDPMRSLSRAIRFAKPGDTLILRGGTYRESLADEVPAPIIISKPITLEAYPGEMVQIGE